MEANNCIQRLKEADRFVVENDTKGNRLNTTRPMEAECEELFETGETLMSTLGFQLFEKRSKPVEAASVYFCTASGTDARAQYVSKGMGSKGLHGSRPGHGQIQGHTPVFSRNFRAAQALLGRCRPKVETAPLAAGSLSDRCWRHRTLRTVGLSLRQTPMLCTPVGRRRELSCLALFDWT